MFGIANFYIFFSLFVFIAIWADFVLLKKSGNNNVSLKEASIWSIVWISLALLFNVGIWFYFNNIADAETANIKATEFFTAYLIEKSLSIDNLFVFLTLFTFLKLNSTLQKKVILIGITGAILLRTIMIFFGISLLENFHWLLYVFGLFLAFTGFKMILTANKEEEDLPKFIQYLIKKFNNSNVSNDKIFSIQNGKIVLSTFGIACFGVMLTDIVFALDSIPAVLAISNDFMIVLTSNIFAILGLRALFFILSALHNKFWALGIGLGIVLIFVGIKMVVVDFFKIDPIYSLCVIISIIMTSIVFSIIKKGDRK